MQRLRVGVFAADGQVEQFVPEDFALLLEFRQLGLGQLAEFEVGAFEHGHRVGDLRVEFLEVAVLGGQLGQRAVLAHQRPSSAADWPAPRDREAAAPVPRSAAVFRRARCAWMTHRRAMHMPDAAIRLLGGRLFGLLLAALAGWRSPWRRTSSGTSRCGPPCRRTSACPCRTDGTRCKYRPSTRACVLRVMKLLPQPQVTLVTTYLGWMPSFMLCPRRGDCCRSPETLETT